MQLSSDTLLEPDLALRIDGLGKSYLIGHQSQLHDQQLLTESIVNSVRRLRRSTKSLFQGRSIIAGDSIEEFWALRGVNAEIQHGEVVGIIGRNGAGKSTLLKMLSRITEPTEGRILLRGRISSLLEVGTGFHPELTGRENILLNGAILGMTRAEVRKKFDEIVDFAQIERFLDTPVKRYSSGMYVRLAFAVAAHLEPEILVVDEVLAVGDTEFQRKCLGKMGEVASGGRTVLFVSHNLTAIESLCTRCLVLSEGRLVYDGETETAVKQYLDMSAKKASTGIGKRKDRGGNGKVQVAHISVRGGVDGKSSFGSPGEPLSIELQLSTAAKNPIVHLTLYSDKMTPIFRLDSRICNKNEANSVHTTKIRCAISSLPIMPGRYPINIMLTVDDEITDHVETATYLEVQASSGDTGLARLSSRDETIFVPHAWSFP